jgi:hypothetical protein
VVVAEGIPVVVAEGVPVATAVPEAVAVAVAVALAVAVGVGARTWFVTAAVHSTCAPPPFAELLHWSMFIGSDRVIVDAPPTVHTNPALVPPFPEPLH